MFSRFIRWIVKCFIRSFLVFTSFSPVVLIFGISQWERNHSFKCFILYFTISVLMIFGCLGILKLAEKKSLKASIHIKELESKGGDILAYLFILLLPFIRSDNSSFGSQPLTTIACIFIIIFAMADVGAYHFNPLMRILRYRIYSIKIEDVNGILIAKTKDILYGSDIDLNVVTISIAHNVYIHTEKMNVQRV